MIDTLEESYQSAIGRARARSERLEGGSTFERLSLLPPEERARILSTLSAFDLARLWWEWDAWARPKQHPPLDSGARILFWMAGRSFGKSRAAAERVRRRVYAGARNIALIGPKTGDVERYMLGTEGEGSGLLNIFHPAHAPVYVGGNKAIVRFHTGAVGYVVSAETPEFRGANLDTVWCDELAQWRYLQTIWTNMELATRARCAIPLEIIVTTTPLPLRFLKELIADEDTLTILGTMRENQGNTDPKFVARMTRKLEGTRQGRQELGGELLGDNPDSLFPGSLFDALRVEFAPPDLRTIVAVDPAIATDRRNDETGIVAMGDDLQGDQYVIADMSGRHKPEAWGRLVVDAYLALEAVAVVGERNRGGDLVESNVRAAMERKRGGIAAKALKFVSVHATKGKAIRAEPVATLNEQGKIHVVGTLPEFESEVSDWNPRLGGPSPNRLDAFVWGSWFLGGLGDEEKPDHRATFAGLDKVTQALQQTQPTNPKMNEAYVHRPTARRGGNGWGNRI